MTYYTLTFSNLSKIIGISYFYISLPDMNRGMNVNNIHINSISNNTITIYGTNRNNFTMTYSGNITAIGT